MSFSCSVWTSGTLELKEGKRTSLARTDRAGNSIYRTVFVNGWNSRSDSGKGGGEIILNNKRQAPKAKHWYWSSSFLGTLKLLPLIPHFSTELEELSLLVSAASFSSTSIEEIDGVTTEKEKKNGWFYNFQNWNKRIGWTPYNFNGWAPWLNKKKIFLPVACIYHRYFFIWIGRASYYQ